LVDKDWLKTLKVGDEVCYKTRWGGYRVVKIAKITPTGQIKTDDNRTFKDGVCRADTWEYWDLEPVTTKVRDYLLKRELVNEMKSVVWEKVPIVHLLMVKNIVTGIEGPKGSETTE
jgi:hypothetical protein